jgi:excisionase family DNA binding protein
MPVVVNKRLLDVKSASEYLSISRALLYQLAANGKISSFKINSRRLFDVNDLDEFVEKLKAE